jgi:hypothetical protein
MTMTTTTTTTTTTTFAIIAHGGIGPTTSPWSSLLKDIFKPDRQDPVRERRLSRPCSASYSACRDTSSTTLPLQLGLYSHFMSVRSTAIAATYATYANDEDDDGDDNNHNDHNYEKEVRTSGSPSLSLSLSYVQRNTIEFYSCSNAAPKSFQSHFVCLCLILVRVRVYFEFIR